MRLEQLEQFACLHETIVLLVAQVFQQLNEENIRGLSSMSWERNEPSALARAHPTDGDRIHRRTAPVSNPHR